MTVMSTPTFGLLLKQLRKRVGMTQRDLAAALGYSDSLISGLEKAQRQQAAKPAPNAPVDRPAPIETTPAPRALPQGFGGVR